ncbi:hypothetical protein C8F04DRAFT_1278252 [Mycena alexandri]|uniref:Uncharacterized protein n=1 Tax=Mycena alexandri TaxID=1745969 RepID=A0AAD6RYX9_9AGAR|nr:hypothetical protein C8F04DRAFT_1278252 [Mycena alexandri]
MEVERVDHGWARFKRTSHDLCIFTRAGIVVRVPWPLKPDGTKLTPREVIALLDREQLYFPCFCSHTQGIPYGCEITAASTVKPGGRVQDQHVFLYCHFQAPRCSFFVDLLAVYTTATVTYSYPASILSQVPYTSQDFVGEYIFRPLIVNGLEHRGFMQNYFGEPRASLAKNQWSLIKTVESFPILEPGQLGPKHTRRTLPPPPNYRCRASIGVQTTEHLPEVHETTLVPVPMQPTPMEPAQDDSDYPVIFVSDLEQTALQALAAGECLTKVEQRQIFKTCTLCNSIVFVRLYNEHVQGCDGGGVFRSLRSRDN